MQGKLLWNGEAHLRPKDMNESATRKTGEKAFQAEGGASAKPWYIWGKERSAGSCSIESKEEEVWATDGEGMGVAPGRALQGKGELGLYSESMLLCMFS